MAESAVKDVSQAVAKVSIQEESRDDGSDLPELSSYNLANTNMGRFIILNMIFDKVKDKDKQEGRRLNSREDVEKLKEVMTGFGFEVIIPEEKLTASNIYEVLTKYANDEYNKDANCIGVAAMSHSTKDGQFKSADMTIAIDEILKPFKLNDENECLRNKPRFFFFQCCRGTEHDMGHQVKVVKTDKDTKGSAPDTGTKGNVPVTDTEESLPSTDVDADALEDLEGHDCQSEQQYDDRAQLLPVVSDMICAYSSYKGYTSRLQTGGSIFIQTLCSTLKNGAGEFDLVELLTIVCNSVTQKDIPFKYKLTEKQMTEKQTPTIVSSLTKKFYLKSP